MHTRHVKQNAHWLSSCGGDSPFATMTTFERDVFGHPFTRIAGVDEAGRGPLAGPIVAAAVVLGEAVDGVNDSKLLSAKQRDSLFNTLMEGPHSVGVSIIESTTIDRDGIQSANYAAMAQAAEALEPAPEFLLVDGFTIRGCAFPQKRIVKGDRKSMSIAAASIIAKVTRDKMMEELDATYPQYGFARHKGYGTKVHLDALRQFGPCPAHRMSFAPLSQSAKAELLFQHKDTHS